MTRRALAALAGVADPGLLVAGMVCLVVAAVMVSAALGWAAGGVALILTDMATGDDPGSARR